MFTNNIKTKKLINNNGELIFYIAYIILLVKSLILTSTLQAFFDIDNFLFRVAPRLIAYTLIIFKFCAYDRFNNKKLALILIFGCFILINMIIIGNYALADIAALVIGAHNIELKNIVKVFFYVTLTAFILFFVLSIFGVIENYITYRGEIPRYAFGNIYATDFAAMVFYLQISNAYIRDKKYSIKTLLFWLIVSVLIFHFCDARLDCVLIIGFALVMYLYAKFSFLFKFKVVKFFLVYGMIISCFIALIIHYFYSDTNSFLVWLNSLLSNRLYLGNRVINDYGISIFGQNIKMQGWGFNTTDWDDALGYYYVDCGFLSILLQYGIIMLLIIIIAYTIVARFSLNNNNFILPIVILFIAITSVVDQHMIQISYNPFIFVISALFGLFKYGKRKSALISHNSNELKIFDVRNG